MKKFTIYLILLFTAVFLYSCKINVSGDDDDDGGNGNNNGVTMHDPFPSNGAINVGLTPELDWSVSSSSFNLTYDIYIDTVNPPYELNGHSFGINSYNVIVPLKGGTTYYWQVKTFYDGRNYSSEVWRFTTVGGSNADSLIAYYPFNGNANDESGKGHNGVNYGAVPVIDRFFVPGSAYNFNGISSYIKVPPASDLQPLNGITLSAWVNFSSFNNICPILEKGSESSAGRYSITYSPASNAIDFQIVFSDYSEKSLRINTTLLVDTWYHITGTYDGTFMRVYCNGQPNNSISISRTLGSNMGDLVFGANLAHAYFLTGSLDDIRLFGYALNENEVLLLYHEGGWKK